MRKASTSRLTTNSAVVAIRHPLRTRRWIKVHDAVDEKLKKLVWPLVFGTGREVGLTFARALLDTHFTQIDSTIAATHPVMVRIRQGACGSDDDAEYFAGVLQAKRDTADVLHSMAFEVDACGTLPASLISGLWLPWTLAGASPGPGESMLNQRRGVTANPCDADETIQRLELYLDGASEVLGRLVDQQPGLVRLLESAPAE